MRKPDRKDRSQKTEDGSKNFLPSSFGLRTSDFRLKKNLNNPQMKTLHKIINLTFLVIFCFLLMTTGESKAQVKKMTHKEMTEVSTAVLYGKCINKRCEWNEKKSIIYTYVTIAPEEYIKGNLGSEAVITIPGGRVGDIIYEVSEMPAFTEGEEVVAFVWTNPRGKNLITGGYKGKMKIEKDAKTGKKTVQVNDEMMDDAEGLDKVPPGQAKKMQLEDFVVKLKGYARN